MGFRRSSISSGEYYDGLHRFEHWYRDNSIYFITARCRDRFPAFVGHLLGAVRLLHTEVHVRPAHRVADRQPLPRRDVREARGAGGGVHAQATRFCCEAGERATAEALTETLLVRHR